MSTVARFWSVYVFFVSTCSTITYHLGIFYTKHWYPFMVILGMVYHVSFDNMSWIAGKQQSRDIANGARSPRSSRGQMRTLGSMQAAEQIPIGSNGAAIYGNMDPINIHPMLAYIYIPYMDPMGYDENHPDFDVFKRKMSHCFRWFSPIRPHFSGFPGTLTVVKQ